VYIWRQSKLRLISLHVDPAQGYTDGHHPLCFVGEALEALTQEMTLALTAAAPNDRPRNQAVVTSPSKLHEIFVDRLSCLQVLNAAKRDPTVLTPNCIQRTANHLQREQSFVVCNLERATRLLSRLSMMQPRRAKQSTGSASRG